MDDGSVEVVACGDAAQVEKLIKWLKEGGPRSARVTKLTEPHSPRETHIRLQYSVLKIHLTGLGRPAILVAFALPGLSLGTDDTDNGCCLFLCRTYSPSLYQHSDGGRVLNSVKSAHEAHDFPVFRGRAQYRLYYYGDTRQRFTYIGAVFFQMVPRYQY